MDSPAHYPDARFDDGGTLVADQTCRRCGYNLRGLHRDGRCPECGAPVGLSVKGDLLRFADPAWVEKLARASSFILNGLAVTILACIALAIMTAPGAGVVGQGVAPTVDALLAACTVAALAGLIVFYLGVWLMTSPDPTRVGEDLYATSRRLVRITLLIGIGNLALQSGFALVTLPAGLETLLAIINLLAGLGMVVGSLAYLRYLGKLSLRIPDDGLARRARFLFKALLVTLLITVVLGFLVVIPALDCALAAVMSAMLVFVLMALRLQYRVGRACRDQARAARETWAGSRNEP